MNYSFELEDFVNKMVTDQQQLLLTAVEREIRKQVEPIIKQMSEDMANQLRMTIKSYRSVADDTVTVSLFINDKESQR